MVTSGKAGIYRPTAPPVRPKVLTSTGSDADIMLGYMTAHS